MADSSAVIELKDALRDTLDRNGNLDEVRAKLRSDIFKALHEGDLIPKPGLTNENLIINELIREYLIYNGYRETLSVFIPETGQPTTRPFDRSFLAEHLNLAEGPNTRKLPLLYHMLASSKDQHAISNTTRTDL